MNYQSYCLLILVSAGYICTPVRASSEAFKKAQEKLELFKAGVQEHQSALSLLGAVAVYATYKKSATMQAGVQSGWKQMKEKSDALYKEYNKPVTLGFWARLGCVLVGGNYIWGTVSKLEKQEVADLLKKSTTQVTNSITAQAKKAKEKFDALSVTQKVATSIGLTAVVTGGVYIAKKTYNKLMRKDPKAAFTAFKAALTESQRTKYSALIDQIEKDPQVFYTSEARDLLVELSVQQYRLAEEILAATLR